MSIYAVNGKEPIAAWIPSLDTAGNGTTTLTDLVGSANGTLTNMDAATDWVVDTDAGGVRALDFDGVDDLVSFNSTVGAFSSGESFSVSLWLKAASAPSITSSLLTKGYQPTQALPWWMAFFTSTNQVGLALRTTSGATSIVTGGLAANGDWRHLVCVYNATLSTVTVYLDGSIVATASSVPAAAYGTNSQNLFMPATLNRFFAVRIDDVRLFSQTLDATDVAALLVSGNGRGITAGASANPTAILQINSQSMRVGL